MKVFLLESNYTDPLVAQAQAEQAVCADMRVYSCTWRHSAFLC
jgi:hypothetical protein